MEKIEFYQEDGTIVEFFVLEQTKIAGMNYILVTDKEEGDGEALILKDTALQEDAESVYEIVSEEAELTVIAKVFEDLLEDVEFVANE